jgi:hypothetical protein
MPHAKRGPCCRVLLSGLLLWAGAGCSESMPAAPTAVTSPSPVPSPAPAPPYKVTGLTGVYDFTAAVDTFDPVWGDLTGYRFSGVLTLVDGAGELTELRGFDAAGQPGSAPPGGPVEPIIQVGLPVLEVVGKLVSFVVNSIDSPPPGQAASPRFTGRFGTGNPTGPFVAVRRP